MRNNYYHPTRTYVGQLDQHGNEHGLGIYSVRYQGRCAANFFNNYVHGFGYKEWIQGETYAGQFDHNVKNGYGHHTWNSGASYTGQFKNNQPYGTGILVTVHGLTYVGKVNGMTACPSGYGGRWFDDTGSEVDPTDYNLDIKGDQYVGDRVDGVLDGSVTMTNRVGDISTGEYVDGVRHGVHHTHEKNFVTTQTWVHGVQTTQGSRATLYYGEAINTYTGHFLSGRYHGPGRLSRHDGWGEDMNFYFGEVTTARLYSQSCHDATSAAVRHRTQRGSQAIYDMILQHQHTTHGFHRGLRILMLGVGRGEHQAFLRELLPDARVVALTNVDLADTPLDDAHSERLGGLLSALDRPGADIITGVDIHSSTDIIRSLSGDGGYDIIINDDPTIALEVLTGLRPLLNNGGVILHEWLDKWSAEMARERQWRTWDLRPLNHFREDDSWIGVWTEIDLPGSPLQLYEVR